jgi:hypothetical protein
MKTIYLFFPLLVTNTGSVESFVLAAPLFGRPATTRVLLREENQADTFDLVEKAHQQWKEEAALLHAMEHAVETDPYLDGVLEPEKSHKVNKHVVEQQAHIHDSLLGEIQYAIEHDPDLFNIVDTKKAHNKIDINGDFMEREAHVHDSLLHEVAHAVDMDPDLVSK